MLANHPNVLGGAGDTSQSGAPVVGGPNSSTDNALVRWDGTTGQLVQNGIVTEADDTGTLTGPLFSGTTTAIGSAFTNQPANDGVEIVSSSAADTTQTATVIGTTNGGNTVVVETVTLNGTTVVSTVKTNWGVILAVKLSASCAGTVTFREASADLTITTVTTGNTSKGVNTVAAVSQLAYARTVSTVSDGATTKQIGFQGTNTSDAVIYDSVALTGATAVVSNSSFRIITEIYTGDVEAARTETVTTNGAWTLTAGAISLVNTGTNQSITLTPSGTGGVVAGTGSPINTSILSSRRSGAGYLFAGTDGTRTLGLFVDTNPCGLGTISAHALDFFTANGTSQVRLATSGNLLIGGLITDGTGVLQLPAATTDAGGMAYGTDSILKRIAAGGLALNHVGASSPTFSFQENGVTKGSVGTSAGALQVVSSAGAATFFSNNTLSLTLDTAQTALFAKKISSYNGVATAGWGVPAIQAYGRVAAASAAGNITNATYTVGAADGTFEISGNINVISAVAVSTSLNVTYTDETNTSRTMIMPLSGLAGSFVAAGLATTVGPFESAVMHIRAKAATAITMSVAAGTFTTVSYNAEGIIKQTA